jgi:cobalt/nickel transport system ATP-binding protein
MSDWMLEFENVSFCYPCSSRSALDQLTLKVPHQKRCALIGQNGCGKTTFFLMAAGLYQPQIGRVYWQGNPCRYDRPSLTQLRQHLGLVFQNPDHQVVASTVEEDISYGLHNLDLPAAEIHQRMQQAIADFDLTDLVHQPIHHLSLGQKKRLSIADIMVLNPKLLLLDEPTAYLDPRHTRDLLDQLQQIHAGGTTILLASHDLDFVYRWADWVFVMDQGHLVLEGPPDAVFAQREILEQLQLGLPLAIELLEQLQAIATATQEISPKTFSHWQQQVLHARRLG